KAQGYYPFSSTLPGRTFSNGRFCEYRFSFNGKKKVDEINGSGNTLDFGARIYDGRLGRFLSVALGLFSDPGLTKAGAIVASSLGVIMDNVELEVDPNKIRKEIKINTKQSSYDSNEYQIKEPELK
ncbi:hypothetical protein, partial [Umezakia ovalisporum]|uniref:hypothetical protein n=1 Tax=Umezakia ovalisporum TaxID=75695 RepID=UPI0039C5CBEF